MHGAPELSTVSKEDIPYRHLSNFMQFSSRFGHLIQVPLAACGNLTIAAEVETRST
jgi:hypothetical protein